MAFEDIRTIAQGLFQQSKTLGQLEVAVQEMPLSWGVHSWLASAYLNNKVDCSEWLPQVRDQYFQNEIRNTFFEKETVSLTSLLTQNQHEYALLKGAWMDNHLLPHSGLRVCGDVDIWVNPNAYEKIDSYMRSLGFETRDKIHHRFHFHKEFRKKNPAGDIIFEIHSDLLHQDFFKIDGEAIWQQAQRDPERREIQFQPHHQLIYIFFHSAIHGFDRPSRLFDLPLIYHWALENNLDQKVLFETLSDWRCRKVFLFSLLALEWLMDEPYGSSLFKASELIETRTYFERWKSAMNCQPPQRAPHRRYLADDTWQMFRGWIHPQRILGALIDRMAYY